MIGKVRGILRVFYDYRQEREIAQGQKLRFSNARTSQKCRATPLRTAIGKI
jgi:hypothetical protein